MRLKQEVSIVSQVVVLEEEEGPELQDINQNYLDESDDYIDITDTEEEEPEQ